MFSRDTTKENIFTYVFLVLICFIFGFIVVALSKVSIYLVIIFVIFTAGLFNFAGGHFIEQGAFNEKRWKIIFLSFSPVIIIIDGLIYLSVDWYNFTAVSPYYLLFTLGLVFKKQRDEIKK